MATRPVNGSAGGVVIRVRVTGSGAGSVRRVHPHVAIAATRAAPVTANRVGSAATRRRAPNGIASAVIVDVSASSISRRASAASASRRLRSFSRHRRNMF